MSRYEVTDRRRRSLRLAALALALILVLALFTRPLRLRAPSLRSYARLPACEKSLLYTFDNARGFASEWTMFVRALHTPKRTGKVRGQARAVLYAEENDYALLYDDSPWNYGRVADYFTEPARRCQRPPQATTSRVTIGDSGWEGAPHLHGNRWTANVIDTWVATRFVDLPGYHALGPWDPLHPLAHDMVVPPPFRRAYEALYRVHERISRVVPEIQHAVDGLATEFGLRLASRPHVIGLHYRGGDKVGEECPIETNCANTTLYAMAARQALSALPPASCTTCRPVLVIMTVEPAIVNALRAEPLLTDTFDVRRLPPAPTAQTGHFEGAFNELPLDVRIADTRAMLRDLVFLATRADAVVASMRSNIGLLATQWTPRDHPLPFSIDEWFLPLSWRIEALGLR